MTCGSPLAREMDFPHRSAQYENDCPGCGDEIGEGDPIYLVDGEWVDENCAEQAHDWSD